VYAGVRTRLARNHGGRVCPSGQEVLTDTTVGDNHSRSTAPGHRTALALNGDHATVFGWLFISGWWFGRPYARNQDARRHAHQPQPTAREQLPVRTLARRRLDTRRRSRATIVRRVSKAALQPVTRVNIRAVRQLRRWASRPRVMVQDSKTDSGLLHQLLGCLLSIAHDAD
jgi:hypothetical protein